MNRHLSIFIMASIALAGCNAFTQPAKVANHTNNELLALKARAEYQDQTPNVYHFTTMYVPVLTETESAYPKWYYSSGRLSFSDAPLDLIMSELAKNYKLKVEYRSGVDRDLRVSVSGEGQTVGGLISSLEATSGYQFEINDTVIVINKYVTEIFPIRSLTGTYEYGIGKKNMGNSGSGTTSSGYATADAVKSTGDEFSKIEGEFDPLIDFKNGVEIILGCKAAEDIKRVEDLQNEAETEQKTLVTKCDEGASVKELRSDNSLLVKALPSQLENVRSFIDDKTERELRQVRLSLTLVAIEVTDDSALGFDFDVIDSVVGGSRLSLNTVSNATASIIGGLTDRGTATLTDSSGTSMALEVLEEHGTILAKNRLRTVASNHRVAKLSDVEKQSFIADRELQTTADVGTTTSIEQQVVESGLMLYALPNIGESDVVLHISNSLSSLLRLDTKGESGNEVESPQISDREFNTTFRVYPNKPVIVGGFSLEDKQSLVSQNGVGGHSRSSTSVETELLLIVEVDYL